MIQNLRIVHGIAESRFAGWCSWWWRLAFDLVIMQIVLWKPCGRKSPCGCIPVVYRVQILFLKHARELCAQMGWLLDEACFDIIISCAAKCWESEGGAWSVCRHDARSCNDWATLSLQLLWPKPFYQKKNSEETVRIIHEHCWFFNFLSAAVATPPTAWAFWPFCFFFFFFFFRLGILGSGWFPQLACCFKCDIVRETFSLSCLHFAWMPMLLALQARRKWMSWLQSMPHVLELSFYMWRKLVLDLNWLDSIAIQDEGCSCWG